MTRSARGATASGAAASCTLLATFIFALLLARDASALELAEVLQRTAVSPPASVPFREERHNPMLREPLVLTGTFEYLAAGTMKKTIESPFAESYLVDDTRIVIERDGKTRTLALSRSRSLRAILVAIEAILAGRSDQLDELFASDLEGDSERWTVTLTPISKKLAQQVQGLHIAGNATSVTEITVNLADDEWHRMEILEATPES
jgi:hypothetical protein